MGFVEAIKLGFQRYVVFAGRSARWEYWFFFLFAFLGNLVLNRVSEALGGAFALALLLPSLAVGARRLHDIDKSGWWQLIWFVPLIGWIILIYWLVQPSQAGANRFGETPLPATA